MFRKNTGANTRRNISPCVFFSQTIGQLVWKICPFNEHISSFKLYNYLYMQYHHRFELARQRVGALSLSSGEKICPIFLIQLKHWNGRTVQLGGSWRSRARACACVFYQRAVTLRQLLVFFCHVYYIFLCFFVLTNL